jgi:hypothetical protein
VWTGVNLTVFFIWLSLRLTMLNIFLLVQRAVVTSHGDVSSNFSAQCQRVAYSPVSLPFPTWPCLPWPQRCTSWSCAACWGLTCPILPETVGLVALGCLLSGDIPISRCCQVRQKVSGSTSCVLSGPLSKTVTFRSWEQDLDAVRTHWLLLCKWCSHLWPCLWRGLN